MGTLLGVKRHPTCLVGMHKLRNAAISVSRNRNKTKCWGPAELYFKNKNLYFKSRLV